MDVFASAAVGFPAAVDFAEFAAALRANHQEAERELNEFQHRPAAFLKPSGN